MTGSYIGLFYRVTGGRCGCCFFGIIRKSAGIHSCIGVVGHPVMLFSGSCCICFATVCILIEMITVGDMGWTSTRFTSIVIL